MKPSEGKRRRPKARCRPRRPGTAAGPAATWATMCTLCTAGASALFPPVYPCTLDLLDSLRWITAVGQPQVLGRDKDFVRAGSSRAVCTQLCGVKSSFANNFQYEFSLDCIPRYRDYSTAKIDCGFFVKICLIFCFRVLKSNQIVLLHCPDMLIPFGVIRTLYNKVVLQNSKVFID